MNDGLLIACFVFDAALIYWIVRGIKRRRYHSNDLLYGRKYSSIHDLEQLTNRLEALEQSIIQIELAKMHKVKGVTVSIPDALSHNQESTILIDGRSDSSRYLLETLNAEKLRLRAELDKKLYRLHRYGCTEVMTGEELSSSVLSPALDPEQNNRSFVRKTKGAEL